MQIASKYHVSENMNLIPGCNKKNTKLWAIGGSTGASPQLKQSQMNSRQQTRTDSLEVNPDTLCKATHTTFSSKIPFVLHQYIPDIFGRIRCDFWNLLILDMVILWDIVHMRYFEQLHSQEKRLYDAKTPTTWTISTFTTKSSICRTSLIASNNQTESVNLTTVAYMCVVSLRYPPFSSCMQGFQKKMGCVRRREGK